MSNIEGLVQDLRVVEQWRPGPQLPGESSLVRSLAYAQETGEPANLVTINCVDFKFSPFYEGEKARYPVATPEVGSRDRSICSFYENYAEPGQEPRRTLQRTLQAFRTVAPTNLSIVVPDSELTDERVFLFNTTAQEREEIGNQTKDAITEALSPVIAIGAEVIFWSDYCKRNNLPSPTDMTTTMFREIERQRAGKAAATSRKEKEQGYPLANAIDRQIKDSRKFLIDRGLNADYVNQLDKTELEERTMWYCAMYMGEGAGIQILLNLEDGRVPAWYERGAQVAGREISIVTPVNPKDYTVYKRTLPTN